jgi:predicted dehydrogenase
VALCAVADTDPDRAAALAEAWEVPQWTVDYRDLLDAAHLDAVILCLPHDLHVAVAVEALEAGLHVLVEKPLATSLAEADAMINTADRAGKQLMVAETVRFDPTYRRIAEIIRAGELGDLFLIRIAREHEMHDYLRQRPWFLQQKSGGIMVSGGIHDYELLRMLGGEIEHVYGLVARSTLPEMVADDTSLAVIGLRSGAAASLTESFSLKTAEPGVHGTAHGSRGSLWFYKERIELYTAAADGEPDLVQRIHVPAHNNFEAECAHFLDCLESGDEPLTSGRDQRKPLAAVLATYESFRTGQRIYLDEMEDNHAH